MIDPIMLVQKLGRKLAPDCIRFRKPATEKITVDPIKVTEALMAKTYGRYDDGLDLWSNGYHEGRRRRVLYPIRKDGTMSARLHELVKTGRGVVVTNGNRLFVQRVRNSVLQVRWLRKRHEERVAAAVANGTLDTVGSLEFEEESELDRIRNHHRMMADHPMNDVWNSIMRATHRVMVSRLKWRMRFRNFVRGLMPVLKLLSDKINVSELVEAIRQGQDHVDAAFPIKPSLAVLTGMEHDEMVADVAETLGEGVADDEFDEEQLVKRYERGMRVVGGNAIGEYEIIFGRALELIQEVYRTLDPQMGGGKAGVVAERQAAVDELRESLCQVAMDFRNKAYGKLKGYRHLRAVPDEFPKGDSPRDRKPKSYPSPEEQAQDGFDLQTWYVENTYQWLQWAADLDTQHYVRSVLGKGEDGTRDNDEFLSCKRLVEEWRPWERLRLIEHQTQVHEQQCLDAVVLCRGMWAKLSKAKRPSDYRLFFEARLRMFPNRPKGMEQFFKRSYRTLQDVYNGRVHGLLDKVQRELVMLKQGRQTDVTLEAELTNAAALSRQMAAEDNQKWALWHLSRVEALMDTLDPVADWEKFPNRGYTTKPDHLYKKAGLERAGGCYLEVLRNLREQIYGKNAACWIGMSAG